MLTLRHIKIYKSYAGDGDGFVRCATQEEKAYMTYVHWRTIEDLVQDLHLIKHGLAAKSFVEGTWKKLVENCDGEETIHAILKLID